jgi:hypothetical protein
VLSTSSGSSVEMVRLIRNVRSGTPPPDDVELGDELLPWSRRRCAEFVANGERGDDRLRGADDLAVAPVRMHGDGAVVPLVEPHGAAAAVMVGGARLDQVPQVVLSERLGDLGSPTHKDGPHPHQVRAVLTIAI